MAGFSGFVDVNNGDVTGNHGGYDFWITKLSSADLAATMQQPEQVQQSQDFSKTFQSNSSSVKIYPNPAKNFLNIEGLPASGNVILCITNLNGNVVMSAPANSGIHTLNIAQLKSGSYMLRISTGNEMITRKFVKE